VAVWQFRAEVERGTRFGAVAATTDSKLDFALEDVAELFSLVRYFAFGTRPRRDPMDIALEQVCVGIGNQPLQSDAVIVDDVVSALFGQADDGVFIPGGYQKR